MKIVKKIVKSFFRFVLLTALLHIGVLVFTAIKNGNIKFLNYFQILGLDEFWPKITNGKLSDVLSIILMTTIFLSFLIFGLIKRTRTEKVEK